jgi:endonuclease-8
VGNVFKSEGCFAAEVDPWRKLGELSDAELRRVVDETASLMRGGLEGRRQERRVYRSAKLPCPRCGAPLRARGQGDANRTTYWCGRCQR